MTGTPDASAAGAERSSTRPEVAETDTLVGRASLAAGGRLALGAAVALLAFASWSVAAAREAAAVDPVDPASVLLRVVAIAVTVRAIAHIAAVGPLLGAVLGASRYGLRLSSDALHLSGFGRPIQVRREHILAIAVNEQSALPALSNPLAGVFVVRQPRTYGARPYDAIPAVFEGSARALSEHLMRWRGPTPLLVPTPAPAGPSRRYAQAAERVVARARHEDNDATLAIRHGCAWASYGPFTTLALALALASGWLRADVLDASLLPSTFLVSLAAVPAAWIVYVGWNLKPRSGLSLVVDPWAVLVRSAGGTMEIPWGQLEAVTTEQRWSWSLVHGFFRKRTLILQRRNDAPIRYDEAYLGVPTEVAKALLDAYRQHAGTTRYESGGDEAGADPG